MPSSQRFYKPIGDHQTFTNWTGSGVVTVPWQARDIVIQATKGTVYCTFDGSTPSATHGFQLKETLGLLFMFTCRGKPIKFLGTPSNAQLDLQWFGYDDDVLVIE